MTVLTWVGVACIGGGGAVGRLLVDGAISSRVGRSLPLGTLVINLTGSIGLGLCVGLGLTGDALLLVGTALIGSFTTFSTWMYETQRLLEDGNQLGAGLNLLVSLAFGFLAVVIGKALGSAL